MYIPPKVIRSPYIATETSNNHQDLARKYYKTSKNQKSIKGKSEFI